MRSFFHRDDHLARRDDRMTDTPALRAVPVTDTEVWLVMRRYEASGKWFPSAYSDEDSARGYAGPRAGVAETHLFKVVVPT